MRILNKRRISSEEFDKRFNHGEDMADFLNKKKVTVNKKVQRINIDFPIYFLKNIDKEARKVGIARTALIKIWLAERLEHIQH